MISLCIPTMNRFDTFLSKYLDEYVKYLDDGLLNEIIICDENGVDYDKILNKYKNRINVENSNFRIYKNEQVLGVFMNKLNVCKHSKNRYIALIDSDNFIGREYLEKGIEFIKSKEYSSNIIISPSKLKTTKLNFRDYTNIKFTKENIKEFIKKHRFTTLLNTGNYIISKDIIEYIIESMQCKNEPFGLDKIASCDVIYFNLLVFERIKNVELYVISGMEYEHRVHSDSEYKKKHKVGDYYLNTYIIPRWLKL